MEAPARGVAAPSPDHPRPLPHRVGHQLLRLGDRRLLNKGALADIRLQPTLRVPTDSLSPAAKASRVSASPQTGMSAIRAPLAGFLTLSRPLEPPGYQRPAT